MGIPQESAERMEVLRGLLERLSTADLTLADAQDLRGRMSDLLGTDDFRPCPEPAGTTTDAFPAPDRGDGHRDGGRASRPRLVTAW